MIIRGRNILRIVLGSALLLSLPLVAMLFSDEMAWGPGDFVLAGVLLVGTGLLYELAAGSTHTAAYRVAVGVALATGVILVWANLAVGLIGSEDNPANLLYAGVLAVGLVGALRARLEPRGMARASFATAIAQALVPVIAIILWRPPMTSGLVQVLGVNAFFCALWVGSALLFRRASARLEVQPAA